MKRILYFSFYFEPDLCAGSFRNSPLVKELAKQFGEENEIVVITTQPNRYSTFNAIGNDFEKIGNITIHRIHIPKHKSGFLDQIFSFITYYNKAKSIYKKQNFDLVFASSSRLFTAFLGHIASKYFRVPLYLDIRDIFKDTIKDVVRNPVIKMVVLPIIGYIENITFSNAKHINLISGGFKQYFSKYQKPTYSFYTNGIDEQFLDVNLSIQNNNEIKKILYAGNIGEGQGLHTIVPIIANELKNKYEFIIVGDGGAKEKLVVELNKYSLSNVDIRTPVKREELLKLYSEADFFFIHLNNFDAFKKVLPSKIFELAAYDKPIIAGVSGYANKFISENISNAILFEAGDYNAFLTLFNKYQYRTEKRLEFIQKFKRSTINYEMAKSILKYING
ncbi:MAG: glycosyltransferase WbuB [Chitinophagaceae bacterium BSSC1]|nr:MAG: glycosyltransferase WbuB [Chitinophagaceae bacterium BSSC1]